MTERGDIVANAGHPNLTATGRALPEVVVSVRGLVKRFGRVTALDGLDLTVRRGSVVGFLGPNGAGKSTTIRILLDLIRPTAGEVRVLGMDPRRGPVGIRRRIGYLPGELRLDDRLNVWQTISSWTRLRGGGGHTLATARTLLERLDLAPDRATRTLSSGNRRKLGIVGAFMDDPELLILDEPTNGLDPLLQNEFHLMVGEAVARGGTVFLSSHVLGEVERVAHEAVVIRLGRVVAVGTVAELVGQARQPFTAVFQDDPPAAALHAVPGIRDLVIVGREVRGSVAGSPQGLLEVLAEHPVERLLMPEPDLEQAFLGFYSEPSGETPGVRSTAAGREAGGSRDAGADGAVGAATAPTTDRDPDGGAS